MARATMRQGAPTTETPSEQIVKSASEIRYVTDSRGRKIGVIKPSPLQRYRLMKILGSDACKNEILLGNAMMAFIVRSINGDQILVNSERQLEVMLERLDDDGLAAVIKCLAEEFGSAAANADDESEDSVKN